MTTVLFLVERSNSTLPHKSSIGSVVQYGDLSRQQASQSEVSTLNLKDERHQSLHFQSQSGRKPFYYASRIDVKAKIRKS
jgi:hypothetical protein